MTLTPEEPTAMATKLPSLDTLISYPTLIVVDKNKKVRRIHTGFNGPATGDNYYNFKKEFERFLEKVIEKDAYTIARVA